MNLQKTPETAFLLTTCGSFMRHFPVSSGARVLAAALFCAGPVLMAKSKNSQEAPESRVKVSINVVPNLVQYDTTRFDVSPGATVELSLKNGCVMPHNLLLIKADAEPAIVAAVTAMGVEGMERHFVPETPGILGATKLLPPGGSQTLTFNAPTEAGEYPYICTFPGHWFTMRGVMRVRAQGQKLEPTVKSGPKAEKVEDALKLSGVSHKPMGTFSKPLLMRTFVGDPGLDPAVFSRHGHGRTAFKYDPKTREDILQKVKDPNTGVESQAPILIPSLRGIAGAIAVNHGPEFSYVWDSTECRLMYAWRGGFLDMNTYWGKEPGGMRPKVYIPLIEGKIVYRASGPLPVSDPSEPAPVFLGYKMEKGSPVFEYRLGERRVREKVVPLEKDGFDLRVEVEGGAGAPRWNISPADAGAVRVSAAQGNQLSVHFSDRPEAPLPASADHFKASVSAP